MRWFGRPDRDYREELETHIAMEERENLARGMAPAEARREALRKFGSALLVRENLAAARPLYFWRTFYGDIRFSIRLLKRNPGLSATIVLILALAIGANTAIFSLAEGVLLRMLPVRDPQSLVIVRALTRQGTRDFFTHTDYEWLRDHNRSLSGMTASALSKLNLNAGDSKERVTVEFVAGNYFSLLGVEPAAGRMLALDDDRRKNPVAVISHAYWQRAFGGSTGAIGKQLQLEQAQLEIIGVAPPGFNGEAVGETPDFWVPIGVHQAASGAGRSYLRVRNVSWLSVMGRLRPGVKITEAQADMKLLLESLRVDLHVDAQNDYLGAIGIEPGGGGLSTLRDSYARPLRLLMALVAIVLLIACANVANLLLARSTARRREFAVRLAIGAGQGRLVRQLLTESFLLATLGAAAGLVIARAIVNLVLSAWLAKGLEVDLNLRVLLFTAIISCGAAVVFGLAPALQSNRIDPWTALKERMAIGAGRRFDLSHLLVVAQTALSVVLLIASGLLLRTFLNLKAVNPGFEQQVIEASLDRSLVSGSGMALGISLSERLSALPGVETVSFSQFGFGEGKSRSCCFTPEGYNAHPNEDKNVRVHNVSPNYFKALGIPLVAGRDFALTDNSTAVINETMARHYFGGLSPLGKRFSWSASGPKDTEIIGVVKDAKYDNLRQETPRLVYFPNLQRGPGPNFVQIRGRAQDRASLAILIADCQAAIRSVNPNLRIATIGPLTASIDRTLAPERLLSWLSAGLGILALLLTSVGLYGILAYGVARRTSEFGIRMALGAGRFTILRSVMREGLTLVGIGLATGLVAAVSFSDVMAKLIFGVAPRDMLTFAAAAATLLLVAAVAIYAPARRATSIEPVSALRCE